MAQDTINRESVIPVSDQIVKILKDRINDGVYASGERLPVEADLAEEFAVSRSTVRNALLSMASASLVERKWGRGTFVAASPDSSSDYRHVVGMVVWEGQIFAPLLASISREARDRGYLLSVNSFQATGEGEERAVEDFLKEESAGLLVEIPQASTYDYQKVIDAGLPVVMIDNLRDIDADYVVSDNFGGARQAVEHLAALGHRSIGHITHEALTLIPSRPERVRGFVDTCKRLGFRDHECPVFALPEHAAEDEVAFCEWAREFLSDRDMPTAYFCYSDFVAEKLFRAVQATGKRVPEDVSIVGFDNSIVARSCPVPLTSIDRNRGVQGLLAVRLLAERVENSEKDLDCRKGLIVPCHIVERDSTAAPVSRRVGKVAETVGR